MSSHFHIPREKALFNPGLFLRVTGAAAMEHCPCREKGDVRELSLCLAPPPGDYEIVLEGFAGSSVVVNDEGVWIRSVSRDEWLPFMEGRDRLASLNALEQALVINNISWEKLLCMVVEALAKAAEHGSLRALERLRSCRSLVEDILGECYAVGGDG